MAHEANDKTVLITGTSTGIGRAAALHLDALGFRVFGTVRSEEDKEALRAAASSSLRTLLLDVSNAASLARAQEKLEQELGDQGLWGLVNNAGIGFTGPLEFVPLDWLRDLFEVNLFGVLAITQICLPFLRQARGRILNVSSSASVIAAPFHGPYTASKLGLNGLSDSLRLELQPFNIQVSVLICGSIKTPIWDTAGSLSDRLWESLPEAAEDLYGTRYQQLRSYFQEMGQHGIPPEDVAYIIADALTADRAKHTYYIGNDAFQFRLLRNLFSERQRDWITLRTIGMDS